MPACAQVYKYLDSHGTTHYKSTPHALADDKPVTFAPLNRQPALASDIPDNPQNLLPEQEQAQVTYTVLTISGLPADQPLRANNGTFMVHASLTPPLHSQHRLQWFLDDQPYGPASAQTALRLSNVDRGTHQLSFKVMTGNDTWQQSPNVIFHLQRARLR